MFKTVKFNKSRLYVYKGSDGKSHGGMFKLGKVNSWGGTVEKRQMLFPKGTPYGKKDSPVSKSAKSNWGMGGRRDLMAIDEIKARAFKNYKSRW